MELADAEFVLSLRLDADLSRYLNPTDPDIGKQREFIAGVKRREKEGAEFFHIIENASGGKPCGTIRLIPVPSEDCFRFGSFILKRDRPRTASVETLLFICRKGFDIMGFKKCRFFAHKDNDRANAFYKNKLGARITGEAETAAGTQHLYEVNLRDWKKFQKRYGV